MTSSSSGPGKAAAASKVPATRPARNRHLSGPAATCSLCVALAAMPWRERYIADDRISHCRDCHAIWSRHSNQQHCTKCHRTFSANWPADRAHGTFLDEAGELRRRCHDPVDRGLIATVNRWGTDVWHSPGRPENGRDNPRRSPS